MKRHGVRLITAAFAAAAAAGCFSDPTSSQQNGPALIQLTRSAAVVPIGDSLLIEARLVDEAGNLLPMTGATWATDNASVADVHVAPVQLPEDASSKAYVVGVATLGGITTVHVTARGVTDSVRVTALPTRYLGTGTFTVTGTPTADTIPGSVPPVAFVAGDTVTVTAPAGITFDATASVMTVSGQPTILLARSATAVTALLFKGYHGLVGVTHVTWLGNATTGDYDVGTLETSDTATVSRARFNGAIVIASGIVMTVTPQAGTTFSATGSDTSSVFVGGAALAVLTRTTSQIVAYSATANVSGPVKVTRINLTGAGVKLDSLITAAPSSMNAAFFPGTVTNGAHNFLDTIVVKGNGSATFDAATSNVTVNGAAAFVINRTVDSIRVIAKVSGTAQVAISNVTVGTTTFPTLATSANVVVNSAPGDPYAPADQAPDGVLFPVSGSTAAAPVNIYGVTAGTNGVGALADHFYGFTLAGAGNVTIQLQFVGSGAGTAGNPDIDLLACDAGCSNFVGGFGGATGANPENMPSFALGAGSYNVYVNGWVTNGTNYSYKVVVFNQ